MKYMEKTCSVYTVDERLNHYARLCNILRSLMMLSLIKSLFHTGSHVNTHFDNSLKKSPRLVWVMPASSTFVFLSLCLNSSLNLNELLLKFILSLCVQLLKVVTC